MAEPQYGHIHHPKDISDINAKIRAKVREADSQEELTELHRESQYLITLTYTDKWSRAYRGNLSMIRTRARNEFHKTAIVINQRARQLGIDHKYDTVYGLGK